MLRALFAASLVALLAGCAHAPVKQQVNRGTKADKLVQKVEQPTPNQIVKKRWYDGFRVRWFNK